MHEALTKLYRSALEKFSPSSDSDLESLRRLTTNAETSLGRPTPELMASEAERGSNWGSYAFEELRAGGFITVDEADFAWFDSSEECVSDLMAQLAALEAAAIVRLSSMDCTDAMPEILERLSAFRKSRAADKRLTSLFAHQRLMLAVVASTGETKLFVEYAKRSSVAAIYARAEMIDDQHIEGMIASAGTMVSLICNKEPARCAAAAAAMRLHPDLVLDLEAL